MYNTKAKTHLLLEEEAVPRCCNLKLASNHPTAPVMVLFPIALDLFNLHIQKSTVPILQRMCAVVLPPATRMRVAVRGGCSVYNDAELGAVGYRCVFELAAALGIVDSQVEDKPI